MECFSGLRSSGARVVAVATEMVRGANLGEEKRYGQVGCFRKVAEIFRRQELLFGSFLEGRKASCRVVERGAV